MNAKELQELIDFISKSGLNKVDIKTQDFEISVTREAASKVRYVSEPSQQSQPMQQMQQMPQMAAPAPAAQAPAAAAPAPAAPAAADSSNLITIKAPMIGTLYRSASPESPVFVNVGDEVKKGQVICIIEAMKLFNEIESEVSGRIVKVLVENSSPVEYDQPLFLVEPTA